MITREMVYPAPEEIEESCKGCVFMTGISLCDHPSKTGKECLKIGFIYKLKRKYKPHYRTPPANYRDSENDLS